MRKSLVLLGALLITVVLCELAWAHNGIEDIAVTVRQVGRGGAFIATEPDTGALIGNPAAIAFMEGSEFYFDGRVWHSSLDYLGALNGTGQDEDYFVPNIGYVTRENDRLAWGAGIFTTVNTAFRVTDYDMSLAGAPAGTTDRTSTKVRFVVFTPGLAYKLNKDTAIGTALHYTDGSANFQAYNMLGDTLGYSLDEPSGKGWALRAGLFHRASENTTLGAYWRSRTHLDITGGVLQMGQMTATPGAVVPGTGIEGFQFPEQYGVGIAQKLDEEWTAHAEYRRLLWGKGSDTVSFVPPAGPPLALAMNWSDQDVYVLGAEYCPDDGDTTWRLGLNHAKSPVPDSTLSPLYPAINEWHYTAGWETSLKDGLNLVTGAVYTPGVTRTSSANNPFNPILGLGQPYTLSQEAWQFGVGLSWSFGKDKDEPTCLKPERRCGCERCRVVAQPDSQCQQDCQTEE